MSKKKVNFASNLEQVLSYETYVPDDNAAKEPSVDSASSSHEAVVYLLETNQHVEDDSAESARGLEKRTEQGAWELYEIQRDGRNAVLGEQEDIQRERGVKSDSALRIARAYSAVTEKPAQTAHTVALKDKEAVEMYQAEETKTKNAQLRQQRANKSEKKTSPLKSPTRSTVVPWGRKVSMPLMDTKDEVEIKERVDSTPIAKGVMEDAAAKALSARKKETQPESEEKRKKKTKRKKSVKVSKKTPVEKTSSHTEFEKLDAQKLKDEICELEKRLARRQAAKAKQIAEQMSLGFKETEPKERKGSKKKSSKSSFSRSALPRKLSKRQLSWSEKSAMANMDPLLAPKPRDPLSMSLSDVSTSVMTSSDLSSSSFDVDGSFSSLGGFVDSSLEPEPSAVCIQQQFPQVESEPKKKLSMFSRLRYQNRKSSRSKKSKDNHHALSHGGAESSCHF